MDELPRRKALLRGLQILSAAAVVPLVARQANAAEAACVEPASESLREALHYMDPAPNPAQACGSCGFFAPGGTAPCGMCMIMSGQTSAKGHCDSWAAKSG